MIGYYYTRRDCDGSLGNIVTDKLAIAEMENGPVKILKYDRPSLKKTFSVAKA